MGLSSAHLFLIRDAIFAGLAVRRGEALTDDVILERANNLTSYLDPIVSDIVDEALKEAARGIAVVGEIDRGPVPQTEDEWNDERIK
jgi:hypothetical protein